MADAICSQRPCILSYLAFDFRMASSSSGVMFLELAQLIRNNKPVIMIANADFTVASMRLIIA